MKSGWFSVFLVMVLSVWTTMHLYVFWRTASLPLISAHLPRRTLALIAVGLWTSDPLARIRLKSRADR